MERRIAKVVQITVVKDGDWAKDVESKGQGCKLPDGSICLFGNGMVAYDCEDGEESFAVIIENEQDYFSLKSNLIDLCKLEGVFLLDGLGIGGLGEKDAEKIADSINNPDEA